MDTFTGPRLISTSIETSEGLDRKLTTNYYARLRFAQQLLPFLTAASPSLSRVVSVLAPGEESLRSFHIDDLDLKQNFSLRTAACHAITMTDFAFEELAEQNPSTSFVHTYPGVVKTGFNKNAAPLLKAATSLLYMLLSHWTVDIDESGERHLFAATSEMYPPKRAGGGKAAGAAENVMKGSSGEVGSGAYLVGSGNEFRGNEKALTTLRGQGARKIIFEHTMETYKLIRG